MSVGRPDPNAFKVITPDVYDQNLAQIAKAKATLEAFEKMNETGKSNYEKILAQEERELEQKIQEGLLARQRLEQLRQRKAIGLLEDGGGTSRIEEVGNSNPDPRRYDSRQNPHDSRQHPQHPPNPGSVSLPVQSPFRSQHQANLPPPNQPNYNGQANPSYNQPYPYPQPQAQYVYPYPVGQPAIQPYSTVYSGVAPYYPTQSQPSQQSYVNQKYHPPPIASQTNNVRQNPGNVNQPQRSQAPSAPIVQHQPSSQVNTPYHPNTTGANQNPPATQVPTTAPRMQQQPIPQTRYKQHNPPINTGATDSVNVRSVASPTTQTPGENLATSSNTPTFTHSGPSQRPPVASSSRPGRPENRSSSSNNVPIEQTPRKDPPIDIPSVPTPGQISLFKKYFAAWGSRVPPRTEYSGDITCGQYSIRCLKHVDGSILFLVNLPTGVVHVLGSVFFDGLLSTATQPLGDLSFQQHPTDPQVPNQPLSNMHGSTSNGLAPTSERPSVAQGPSLETPVKAAQLERRVGTITSPKQADKKRIAQSVLFALGKRRREIDSVSDAESHTSKKQAMDKGADEKLKATPAISEPTKGENLATATSQNSTIPTSSIAPLQQPKLTTEITALPSSAQPSPQTPRISSPKVAQASTSASLPSAPTGPNSALSTSLPLRPSTQNEPVNTAPLPVPQRIQFVNYVPLHPSKPSEAGSLHSGHSAPPHLPAKTTPREVSNSTAASQPFSQSARPSSSSQIPISNTAQKKSTPSVLGQNIPPATSTSPLVSRNAESSPNLNTSNPETTTPQLQTIPPVRRSLLPTSLAPTSLPPSISQPAGSSVTMNKAGHAAGSSVIMHKADHAAGPSVTINKADHAAGSSVTINKVDHVSIPTPSSVAESASTKLPPPVPASASILVKELMPKITYLKGRSSRQSPEPVASSSKLASAKEPLFLPSSPSAESDDRLGLWGSENGGDIEQVPNKDSNTKIAKAKQARTQRRVNNAYVLVPPAPEYLVRYRQKQKQKHKKTESGQLSSSFAILRRKGTRADSSMSVGSEEDFSHSFESRQLSSNEESEREAIALACSRLQVAPCRWDGCDAEMNSVEALICHLEVHKQVASQHAKTFMCRWTQCGQQGIKAEDVHMEKHALLPLRCAYTGCDDSFRSEGQLLRHFRTKHSQDELKPSAKPTSPSTLPDPPPIPGIIPSYLIVTSLAGRPIISKERHNIISQQILKNMTCSDQTVPSKQRTRKNARATTRPNSPASTAHLTNDYQFLENNNSARSSTYFSKACDLDHADLDRESVSNIVGQGFLLLGSDYSGERDGGDDDDNDDSLLPSSPLFSPLQQRVSRGEIKVEPGWEEEPSYGGSASRRDEHSSDEDAAVETMLTDLTSTRTSTS